MIIETEAYPRAGLVGNPSDGYFGRTIAFCFSNFKARVVLFESPELEIVPHVRDHSRFESIRHLAEDVGRYGYYGGIRLLKAAVKRFFDYATEQGLALDERNFTIRYASDIPHQVGLAGSSAIITACFRALMTFYGVTIPPQILANLVLSVEVDELKIAAGLQDRVVQAYEGLVYMDFNREHMEEHGFGRYEPLSPERLPPLYIAYRVDLSECSDVFHNDVRARFNRQEPEVVDAMHYWADLAQQVRDALLNGRGRTIGALLDANFDRRRRIYRIARGNLAMVEAARNVGASAKFTGSGGAIVGTYADERMYKALVKAMEPLKVNVIKPALVPGRSA